MHLDLTDSPFLHRAAETFIGAWRISMSLNTIVCDSIISDILGFPPSTPSNPINFDIFKDKIHKNDLHAFENELVSVARGQAWFISHFRIRDAEGAWHSTVSLGRGHSSNPETIAGVSFRCETELVASQQKQQQSTLTLREMQCLQWCSRGKTSWETGQILGLSSRTVEHYINSATRKLECSTRIQAVAAALRLGHIS